MPQVRKTVALNVDIRGRGPALVLTHGLGDGLETWDAVVDELAEHHRVVRWDLRGHGGSERPASAEAYSAEIAVADLLDVMAQADDRPALVGHSLGGYLSLLIALRHPEQVRSLVMISSGPGYRDPDGRRRWNEYVDRAAEAMPIPRHAARLCHQSDGWVIERLHTLRPPLLQIVGGNDSRFHAGVEYVQRAVAGSGVEWIEGAGHHPQQTHPAAVGRAVLAHLGHRD